MSTTKSSVVIRDRLLGRMSFSADFARLFDTREMRRLDKVRMSIPPQFLKKRPCASRLEHSIGIAYLAQVMAIANPEFESTSLEWQYAAATHDIATNPFGHCCDWVMQLMLGMNHEEFRWKILDDSEVGHHAARIGIDLQVARTYGESVLFSGYPDLDNTGNTPLFCTTMGIGKIHYNPIRLAEGFCQVGDKYCLRGDREKEVIGWADCRREGYEYIYSPAHEAPYLMLRRAIELMANEGKLPLSFFTMTDFEALSFLETKGSKGARWLIAAATKHEYYKRVVAREVVVGLGAWLHADILASKIVTECNIPEDSLCVCVQGGRGQKCQTLPFVDANGSILPLPPNGHMQYRTVVVYVAPAYQGLAMQIGECVEDWSTKALYQQLA